MAFCTTCGKANLDTAKFCVGCGKKIQSELSNLPEDLPKPILQHPPVSAPPRTEPASIATSKTNPGLYWLLGIIALSGVVLLIYFLTKQDGKKETVAIKEQTKSGKDTSNTKEDSGLIANNNTQTQNFNDTASKAISDTYSNTMEYKAEQKVRSYFTIAAQRNFDNIYPYLYYCTRYYSTYNPTRESVYKDCIGYWDKVTDIRQTINNVRIENTNNFKDCFVNMDYFYFSIKDQMEKAIPNLNVKVRLDNNNNIIEIYEISRGTQ